jgi:hypothetical protein
MRSGKGVLICSPCLALVPLPTVLTWFPPDSFSHWTDLVSPWFLFTLDWPGLASFLFPLADLVSLWFIFAPESPGLALVPRPTGVTYIGLIHFHTGVTLFGLVPFLIGLIWVVFFPLNWPDFPGFRFPTRLTRIGLVPFPNWCLGFTWFLFTLGRPGLAVVPFPTGLTWFGSGSFSHWTYLVWPWSLVPLD